MDTQPLVEILLATYNGAKFVAAQIDSIRSQSYRQWRLLISDDGSTDGTVSILEHYASVDERIVLLSTGVKRGSPQANFMYLMQMASAQYVMLCDQDDVWLEGRVELMLEEMQGRELSGDDGASVLVWSDLAVAGPGLELVHDSFVKYSGLSSHRTRLNNLLVQNQIPGCACMFNSALLRVVQRTPAGQYVRMHDRWLGLVAAAFGAIHHVDVPTSLYRQHSANAVGARRFSVINEVKRMGELQCSVDESCRMADSFLEVYGTALSDRNRATIAAYAALPSVGPLRRLVTVARHRFLPSGVPRMIGYLLLLAKPSRFYGGRNSTWGG